MERIVGHFHRYPSGMAEKNPPVLGWLYAPTQAVEFGRREISSGTVKKQSAKRSGTSDAPDSVPLSYTSAATSSQAPLENRWPTLATETNQLSNGLDTRLSSNDEAACAVLTDASETFVPGNDPE
jgi:hypothetical protein